MTTAHKPIEMFLKFFLVLFPGDAALSWRTFLTMINNLKLTNIIGGKNKALKAIKYAASGITKAFLDIIYKTMVGMSNIARRVSSLRLVTDV